MKEMKLNVRNTYTYQCESHSFCYSQKVILSPGKYLIECYGASGGITTNAIGGSGAIVSGIISLNRNLALYLFIGAEGVNKTNSIAYNGGGRSCLVDSVYYCTSGGGSTDIRLQNTTTTEGLLSRIMVASGGGGSISWSGGAKGGYGGFLEGQSGLMTSSSDSYSISVPSGGTQTSFGIAGKCKTNPTSCEQYNGYDGSFGIGGNTSRADHGGGGGGGYFGGGGGSLTNGKVSSGAGGSSYVSGYSECHSFELSNGDIIDRGTPYHYSGYYFTNVQYHEDESGNYGNGKIVITKIQNNVFCTRIQRFSSSLVSLVILMLVRRSY